MARPLVSVILRGGFGNQLFQYAAALDAATRRGDEAPLVLSYGNEWGDDHPTLGGVLPVSVAYPDRMLRSTIPGICVRETWKDRVSIALASAFGAVRGTVVWRQRDPFAPDLPPQDRPVVLDGWFQHPRWWSGSWRTVAEELAAVAPKALLESNHRGLPAVHLRRGDYLRSGWELHARTYREAFGRLGWRDREVLVIAGDAESRAFITPILGEFGCIPTSPPALTGNPNIDDFWNLAGAGELVIANSSYSWWAAAAGRALGATEAVIFPAPWLPNEWGSHELPEMGPPGDGWLSVPTHF